MHVLPLQQELLTHIRKQRCTNSHGDYILYRRAQCLWVLSMELASCHNRILRLLLHFWKICAPLYMNSACQNCFPRLDLQCTYSRADDKICWNELQQKAHFQNSLFSLIYHEINFHMSLLSPILKFLNLSNYLLHTENHDPVLRSIYSYLILPIFIFRLTSLMGSRRNLISFFILFIISPPN